MLKEVIAPKTVYNALNHHKNGQRILEDSRPLLTLVTSTKRKINYLLKRRNPTSNNQKQVNKRGNKLSRTQWKDTDESELRANKKAANRISTKKFNLEFLGNLLGNVETNLRATADSVV